MGQVIIKNRLTLSLDLQIFSVIILLKIKLVSMDTRILNFIVTPPNHGFSWRMILLKVLDFLVITNVLKRNLYL